MVYLSWIQRGGTINGGTIAALTPTPYFAQTIIHAALAAERSPETNVEILIQDILAILPSDTRRCNVYISDGRIAALDTAPAGFVPTRTITGAGRLLIPGLINAHTHAYMTVFRNLADDLSFSDWLFGKISPMEERLRGEDFYWGSLLGCMEMISTGTTAFLDMHMCPHQTAQAVADSGMRAVLSRGLTGGDADRAGGARRIREALDEAARWRQHDRLSFMLAPHAPYTCDPGYMREIAVLAQEEELGIHIHLAESRSEIAGIQEQYGCTPISLADQCGLLGPRTVAAHCVHLSAEDIQLLAERQVSVASNPVSNLKLANGVAPVPALLTAGVNVALGTDGCASNNALNMFRELGFMTLLHKGLSGNPQCISAGDGFRMATQNGAKALGLSCGAILPGLSADLTILNLDCPNLQPTGDPVAALAYSATGKEVETVICGGDILYENGNFTRFDAERVIWEVNKITDRICNEV